MRKIRFKRGDFILLRGFLDDPDDDERNGVVIGEMVSHPPESNAAPWFKVIWSNSPVSWVIGKQYSMWMSSRSDWCWKVVKRIAEKDIERHKLLVQV